ncbi:hypothetical protein FQR65_LT05758 [Abscondita terminalis]|nr:hypothetical protein FQR65_LT05758 [Abscondita terminalis]
MEQSRSGPPDDCSTDSEEEIHRRLQDQRTEDLTMPLLTEDKMRRKLQFFFMNPIEKWQAKRRFPYKFMVQLIKIVLVTIQLCLFANSRYTHVDYTWDNRVTFSHIFLNGWDPSREINSYPPSAGPLAIYKSKEFFETIDYALNGYERLNETIGPYSYPTENNSMPSMQLCLHQYKKGIIFGFNESYIFDSTIEEECYNITKELGSNFQSAEFFKDIEFNFAAIVRAFLTFSVKTVSFSMDRRLSEPDCYRFDIVIDFDNRDHDGQMMLSLDAEPVRLTCQGDRHYVIANQIDAFLTSLLNMLVIIICTISFVLCSRALWRAQQLKTITNNFFKLNFHRELHSNDKMDFLNLWYIMIIVNDVLIIVGSGIKEQIERNHFTSSQWDIGGVFLGTGNMLVWFGVLRYLGFFKTYNVLILTLKKATPKVARFSLCALIIYAGFTFCGWLVLGPYHMKFRSLTTTSECLFALVNGDDMFATFSIMDSKSSMLWCLFIAVIMDAYDTIKVYYSQGFPKSDLQAFIGDTTYEDVSGGLYRSDSSGS